jgi:hypothetical protein
MVVVTEQSMTLAQVEAAVSLKLYAASLLYICAFILTLIVKRRRQQQRYCVTMLQIALSGSTASRSSLSSPLKSSRSNDEGTVAGV